MRQLLSKNKEFIWSNECQNEFVGLKENLKNAPSLQAFIPGEETTLVTDASSKGLGAILKQDRGGKEHLIACASRSLRGAELNYSVIEKEALAIFWALNKFRNFGELILKFVLIISL